MNFEILYYLLFLAGFFISLFTLFALSKNDFVLLRRGVTLRQIFDVTFLSLIPGLFLARIIFIFNTFSYSYFHPIQFFHIVLYPGMSFAGFLIGFVAYVIYYFSRKKAFLRSIDLYAVSLFPTFLSYLIYDLFRNGHGIYLLIVIFLTVIIFVFFVNFYRHFTIRDGSIGVLSFFYIFLILGILSFTGSRRVIFDTFSIVEYICFAITLGCLVFFAVNQFVKKL